MVQEINLISYLIVILLCVLAIAYEIFKRWPCSLIDYWVIFNIIVVVCFALNTVVPFTGSILGLSYLVYAIRDGLKEPHENPDSEDSHTSDE